MNNHNEFQKTQADWTTYLARLAMSGECGQYETQDKHKRPITLEYKILNVRSSEFASTMRRIGTLATQAFTSVELQFLQHYPEAITSEPLYKGCLSLVQDGLIDWPAVEKMVSSKIHYLYNEMDWSKLSADDVYIFVAVHDKLSSRLLGFITFFIRPSFAPGDCKIISMGVIPDEQNRGLGKILMSTIFRIAPKVQRLFLCTRVTNTQALAAYYSWGFTHDKNPVQEPGHTFNPAYWTFLQYKTNASNKLQTIAEELA